MRWFRLSTIIGVEHDFGLENNAHVPQPWRGTGYSQELAKDEARLNSTRNTYLMQRISIPGRGSLMIGELFDIPLVKRAQLSLALA
jgi:hypothetical protein